ncbi:MAG: right-handed parallel beta-helix repeat-containing protein [Actinomycetes bacterium]|nr:right-handed parallel beta-helix repeat-containing protein [Actinomycetes bacterium]MDX5381286.1 right-handed parallel beta-helix repeat-containing protein [Actinomycetes bacterium]MDX5451062.1 right-handed parallel beta-helix repeat-containing protein [Actinomycetes bacterium]
MRAMWSRVVSVLGAALLLAGCGQSPTMTTSTPVVAAMSCADLPARIVDAVQEYVDSFGATDPGAVAGAVTARQGEFAATTAELRSLGEDLGCDPDDLADGIREELGRLVGGSPVQDAIADTFRAGPLGTADPSDLGAIQVAVGTTDELVAALAVAGSGSVIRLGAGEYRLTQPLVMLRAVTLVGAGQDDTVVVAAAEGALVIATDGDAVVRDLAISGGAAAVQVAAGGYVLERLRIEEVAGYAIVLRPAANPLLPAGARRELTDVAISGATAGGVVVAGSEVPSLSGISVDGSDGCGLCFVEQAAGTATGVSVADAQVGVRVDDDAAPTVRDVTVTGSDVGVAFTGNGAPGVEDSLVPGGATGIQVTGDGVGTVARTRLADVGEVGVRVSGSARVSLVDLSLEGTRAVGIAVVGAATPILTGGRVGTTGEVGVIWAETAGGTATGVTVGGSRLALQVSDDASPTISGVTVESAAAGALLANGRSAGEVSGLTCPEGDGAVVALAEQTTVVVTGTGCQIVDDR